MIKKFSFPTKKASIPMKQEEPSEAPMRIQKPKWVRWSTVDGKLRRDWFPGFLAISPNGWAAEGSAEEISMRDGQLAAPF